MQEIKVRFNPEDIQHLERQAAAAGTNRTALIRDRALSSGLPRLSTAAYHALVADAAAFMRGDLPKLQVETLIAYVITRLDQHSRQADTRHQSTS